MCAVRDFFKCDVMLVGGWCLLGCYVILALLFVSQKGEMGKTKADKDVNLSTLQICKL